MLRASPGSTCLAYPLNQLASMPTQPIWQTANGQASGQVPVSGAWCSSAPTPPTLALLIAPRKGAHMRLEALTLRGRNNQQALRCVLLFHGCGLTNRRADQRCVSDGCRVGRHRQGPVNKCTRCSGLCGLPGLCRAQ